MAIPLPSSNKPARSSQGVPAQPAAPVAQSVPQAPIAQIPVPQASAQPNPVQKVPVQQAPPAAAPKAAKKGSKFFLKPDWLFIVACVIAVLHVMLLVFVENEKNEFNALKQEDADRVYILQKASSVTQQEVNELEGAFLDEKEVISFIQTLETSRPKFDEFTLAFTSDVPQGKDPHYLPFNITAIGGHTTLVSFVEKLLSSRYVIDAANITLSADSEDATKTELTFTGNLYIRNGK